MTEKLEYPEKPEKGGNSKGKGKGRKLGRNKTKCLQYRNLHKREKNKIKRVLQSNGITFAKTWASEHGVTAVLHGLMAGRA